MTPANSKTYEVNTFLQSNSFKFPPCGVGQSNYAPIAIVLLYIIWLSPRNRACFCRHPCTINSPRLWGNLKLLDSRNVITSYVFESGGVIKKPCLMRRAMFILCSIKIIMAKRLFWVKMFDFEHMVVSRKCQI